MTVSASKANKRTSAFWEVDKARKDLAVALDHLASASDALAAVKRALGHIKQAAREARATRFDWQEKGEKKTKIKRDALPAGIRRSIATEQRHLEKLMERVKAIPVTKDQVIAARAEKAKHKTKKKRG